MTFFRGLFGPRSKPREDTKGLYEGKCCNFENADG